MLEIPRQLQHPAAPPGPHVGQFILPAGLGRRVSGLGRVGQIALHRRGGVGIKQRQQIGAGVEQLAVAQAKAGGKGVGLGHVGIVGVVRGQRRRCAHPDEAQADRIQRLGHQLSVADAQAGAAGRAAAKRLEGLFGVEHGLVVAQRQPGQAGDRHRQPQPAQAQAAQCLVGAVLAAGGGVPGRAQHQPQHRAGRGDAVPGQRGRHHRRLLIGQFEREHQRPQRAGGHTGHCRVAAKRRRVAQRRPAELHRVGVDPAVGPTELQVEGVDRGAVAGAVGRRQQPAQRVSVKVRGVAAQAEREHHAALALGQGQQRRYHRPAQHLGGWRRRHGHRHIGQAAKRLPARLGGIRCLIGRPDLAGIGRRVDVVPQRLLGRGHGKAFAVALGDLQHLGGTRPIGWRGRSLPAGRRQQVGQPLLVDKPDAQRGQARQAGRRVHRLAQHDGQHVGHRTGRIGCRQAGRGGALQHLAPAAEHQLGVGISANLEHPGPVGAVGRHAVGQGQAALQHRHDEVEALGRHAEIALDAGKRRLQAVDAAGHRPGHGAERGRQHGVKIPALAQRRAECKAGLAALAGAVDEPADLIPITVEQPFDRHHAAEIGQRQIQLGLHKSLHIGAVGQHGVGLVGAGHLGQAVVQLGVLGFGQAQRAAQIGLEIGRLGGLERKRRVALPAGQAQHGIDAGPVGGVIAETAAAQHQQAAEIVEQRQAQAAVDKADDLLRLQHRLDAQRVRRLAGGRRRRQAGQQRQRQRIARRRAAQRDAQHGHESRLPAAAHQVLAHRLADAGAADVGTQRAQLRHLHGAEQQIGLGAVDAVQTEAVFTGAQRRAGRQAQPAAAVVGQRQHMHLVGHGTLAHHAQDLAVIKVQVAGGQAVELVAGQAQQIDKRQ